MNRQMQGFVDYVRTEMLSRMQGYGQVQEAGLVPVGRPMVVPPVATSGAAAKGTVVKAAAVKVTTVRAAAKKRAGR